MKPKFHSDYIADALRVDLPLCYSGETDQSKKSKDVATKICGKHFILGDWMTGENIMFRSHL